MTPLSGDNVARRLFLELDPIKLLGQHCCGAVLDRIEDRFFKTIS
jgi:hypothetical protein